MKLTPLRRTQLEMHTWRVQSVHELTRTRICEYLAHHQLEAKEVSIFYCGKYISVFIIPFIVAEQLSTNKIACGYEYQLFHKRHRDGVWSKWKEEKKTPLQKIAQMKKAGVLKKGALRI
jgi:hypothetical protein